MMFGPGGRIHGPQNQLCFNFAFSGALKRIQEHVGTRSFVPGNLKMWDIEHFESFGKGGTR